LYIATRPLFSESLLATYLESQERELFEGIDRYDSNSILNTSVNDLCDYFVGAYQLEPPVLKEREINIDQREILVDVSHDFSRVINSGHGPVHQKGIQIQFFVAYEGAPDLLKCRPSQYSSPKPRSKTASWY
jgi:hypothetical protein